MSRLQKLRAEYKPVLPHILKNVCNVRFKKNSSTSAANDVKRIQELFPLTFGRPIVEGKEGEKRELRPLRIGVVFSGGQAAGGHNVIAGIFDAINIFSSESKIYGFLEGPQGIITNKHKQLRKELIDFYRNQGGFDLIGSGRTKIETEEQLSASLKTVQELNLDGLVIIGGDDSNTNAAILAEYFLREKCQTTVIGVPKTIDGDLRNAHVAISFGFDTATKTYSEMIGNIARDVLSAKKYYHFIRLMGRSASHITLECSLATHPNLAFIGEEIAAKKITLKQITDQIVELIEKRSEKGLHYGVILIPEGLIEFIPEVKNLIQELNVFSAQEKDLDKGVIFHKLSKESKVCFEMLPEEIQKQLLLERDPHGNVQVSMIETEKLLMSTVSKELKQRKFKKKFAAQNHFFGYEGRAGFPSNFDSHYCYALGFTAALLVDEQLTGYMTCIRALDHSTEEWQIAGLPITMLMNMEMRKGKEKPVIRKALVDLDGKAFAFFAHNRSIWSMEDCYRFPGPIQFFSEKDITDSIPLTLQLEV